MSKITGDPIAADWPFDPKKSRIYYGWWIALTGTLCMVATIPATPAGLAPFIDLLMDDLQLDRGHLASCYLWGTIASGVLIPFAGFWVDRVGVRIAGAVSFFALGITLFFMGSPEMVLKTLETLGLSHSSAITFYLFIGFFAMRFWGLGMTMTTCRATVFRWFVHKRSLIAGLNGTILSLSFSSLPFFLNWTVVGFGWRETWKLLGLFFAVVFVFITILFFRDSPEKCDIPVERASDQKKKKRSRDALEAERDFTAWEAVRTYAFWLIAIGLCANAFIGTGLSFHIVSIGDTLGGGMSRNEAFSIFLYVGAFNIVTALTLALIAERIRLRYLLSAMLTCNMISMFGLLNISETWGLWLYASTTGIAWGFFGILINIPWPRYYGRKHLGAINGIVSGFLVVFSALGPYAFGMSFQKTSSYETAVYACLLVLPFLAILGLTASNPSSLNRKSPTET